MFKSLATIVDQGKKIANAKATSDRPRWTSFPAQNRQNLRCHWSASSRNLDFNFFFLHSTFFFIRDVIENFRIRIFFHRKSHYRLFRQINWNLIYIIILSSGPISYNFRHHILHISTNFWLLEYHFDIWTF